MIEIFVLLMWVDGYKAGGALSAEFNSYETCDAAGEQFKSNVKKSYYATK